MKYRVTALAVFATVCIFGQSAVSPPPAPAAAAASTDEIQPDLSDPGVVRAQQNLDRVRGLVKEGAMPMANLTKAQAGLEDALDDSILRFATYTRDLSPAQADQMVRVAERMLLRRQRAMAQLKRLADSGVISRSEAEAGGSDELSARLDLDLAKQRASLVQQIAQSIRMQKSWADDETDAETHPEWNGKLYTRYDGSGIFTRADFDKVAAAFMAVYHHAIPVTADGQTAVHRSLGFNHAGRVDIGLNPNQPEGMWLLRYLQKYKIPYYAFKAAIAGKATGPHIHLGPGSTRLALLR